MIRFDNHKESLDWGLVEELDEAFLLDYIYIGMIQGQDADFNEDFGILFNLIEYYLPNNMITDIFNETIHGGVIDIHLLDYYM